MKNKILQNLSDQNFRITPDREKIIEYFSKNKHPLTAVQILKLFKDDKITVHRATIYREIEFLLSHDVIHPLNLSQCAISYELNIYNHHHHFVCEKCENIMCIIPKDVEIAINKFEKKFEKKEKAKINYHSLKFFGVCVECNDK